jgi:polyhydroxyalkanoate synthesis regulator phasin
MTTLRINLIDGEFTPEETREIVIDLINKKIQFHSVKSHENWAKNGKVDTFSDNRIKELEQARDSVLELTKSEHAQEIKMTINSFIEIEG